MKGQEDPFLKLGEANNRAIKGSSDFVWALQNIDFKVPQGEVLGIIGKNGAGKSTLLKLLSRVTAPTTGNIVARGRMASLLEVGTGFHPELTGRENIFLNGAILGMTKKEIRAKLDEIIDFSGVERYIDTPVKRYSSGMYVRLAFAVAAHLEPEILVVDEVLAVGDADFQKKAIGKMKEVSKGDGRTVLFVSHNMASVKNLCTSGIVLENGQLTFSGTADESVDYYMTSGVQSVDLSNQNRNGNGKLRVVGIDLLDEKEEKVSQVISGKYVKINMHLEKNDVIQFEKLKYAIELKDEYDQDVAVFLSDEMVDCITPFEGKSILSLEITHMLLRAGSYRIRIIIAEGGTGANDFCDIVENAGILEVLPGDVWGVNVINKRRKGTTLPSKLIC